MARPGQGKSRTDPKSIAKAERRKKALQLRLTGASYPRISESLGISLATAFRDVDTAIKEIPKEEADELRRIETESLTELETRLWQRFVGHKLPDGSFIPGDTEAANKILRVKERRARMLGLDAPTKLEAEISTPYSNLSDEELDARIAALSQRGNGKPSGGKGKAASK